MGGRAYGDILAGDIDAYGEAFGVDVREMVLGLLWVLVRYIEAYVVESVYLHLLVYGTCNDVAWCQRQALVVFLHERLAIG